VWSFLTGETVRYRHCVKCVILVKLTDVGIQAPYYCKQIWSVLQCNPRTSLCFRKGGSQRHVNTQICLWI